MGLATYNFTRPTRDDYEDDDTEEITLPIGDFVINNATGVQLAGGAYYHYSEVCKLLKKQSSTMYTKDDVLKMLNKLVEHPNKPGYKRQDVVDMIKKVKKNEKKL